MTKFEGEIANAIGSTVNVGARPPQFQFEASIVLIGVFHERRSANGSGLGGSAFRPWSIGLRQCAASGPERRITCTGSAASNESADRALPFGAAGACALFVGRTGRCSARGLVVAIRAVRGRECTRNARHEQHRCQDCHLHLTSPFISIRAGSSRLGQRLIESRIVQIGATEFGTIIRRFTVRALVMSFVQTRKTSENSKFPK